MSIEYTACKQKLTISLAVFAKIKKLGFLRAGATQIFLRHFLAMKSIKKALEEKLYEDYHEQGFEVLDFPCNQFLRQAPESDEEINQICSLRFHTNFIRFKKVEVNGDKAEPLFVFLCSQNEDNKYKRVKWNFTKFLIGRNGEFIARFEPTTKPEEIEDSIKKALEK